MVMFLFANVGLIDFLSKLDERCNNKVKKMEQQWLENKEKLEPHLQADHLPVLLSGLLIHSGKVCYICTIVHIRCKMLCHISLIIFLVRLGMCIISPLWEYCWDRYFLVRKLVLHVF